VGQSREAKQKAAKRKWWSAHGTAWRDEYLGRIIDRDLHRDLIARLEATPPKRAEVRRRAGLTQVELARILGVSDGLVVRWERGQPPLTGTLQKPQALARYLQFLKERTPLEGPDPPP